MPSPWGEDGTTWEDDILGGLSTSSKHSGFLWYNAVITKNCEKLCTHTYPCPPTTCHRNKSCCKAPNRGTFSPKHSVASKKYKNEHNILTRLEVKCSSEKFQCWDWVRFPGIHYNICRMVGVSSKSCPEKNQGFTSSSRKPVNYQWVRWITVSHFSSGRP